jgi:hypothetical protein
MTFLDYVRIGRDFAIFACCIYFLCRFISEDIRFRRRK